MFCNKYFTSILGIATYIGIIFIRGFAARVY